MAQLPEDRKEAIIKLRQIIKDNLPSGFDEVISYGMLGYVVPHSIYPKGYHVDSKLPLPFINIASQKNHIAIYHMGLYSDKKLLEWFVTEYAKLGMVKLNMGKSCIRFKKSEHIPFDLIAKLFCKITPQQWINIYESK
ncbi:MAG: DUF1801 domain-containing protein [Chlamydiia bacterium]|nr:DUF1801 domain-containing protein [Chlamydiia bacterium]